MATDITILTTFSVVAMVSEISEVLVYSWEQLLCQRETSITADYFAMAT